MTSPTPGDDELRAPRGSAMVTGRLPDGSRLAIVASRFHGSIVQKLLDGAAEAAAGHGIVGGAIDVFPAPGAFELPVIALEAARTGRYAAVVALGCVIRGDTPHFEYVCNETWRGLQSVALSTRVPVAAGVLTCDTMEQALARAGGEHGNKGAEAAETALAVAATLTAISDNRR